MPGRQKVKMQPRRAPLFPTSATAKTDRRHTSKAWLERHPNLSTKTIRRLGIKPSLVDGTGLWASQAQDVLGVGSFVEFPAIRTRGKVIWCNFELARLLGFKVPQSNQLTAEFAEQLLTALSFRTLESNEMSGGLKTITMYADRYGGDGLGPALGAGRAAFLPYGNLYVKGIGLTPLFRHNDPTDFVHSHGGCHLEDCLSEAVFGEVNENLFTQGSIRILAIIDQDRQVIDPTGQCRRLALAVRAGAQFRPGHLLGRPGRGSKPLLQRFIDVTRATGQLVPQSNNSETPDIKRTILRIVDDHAVTSAEAFRWRMIHGAISASNMEMSGAMLDLPTQSTQPRTAPVRRLDFIDYVFGTEHMGRAFELMAMYRKLLKTCAPGMRKSFNAEWVNIPAEMQKAYLRELQLILLKATGVKAEVARWIQVEYSELAVRFTDLILRMAALRNPGNVWLTRSIVKDVSVLDVFHLLGRFPADYFQAPNANHSKAIRKHLKPVYRGNRFHVAKKKTLVASLATEFAGIYDELMRKCFEEPDRFYGDAEVMRASIIARAEFENEPLDPLYYLNLYPRIHKTIDVYKSTGNVEKLRSLVDETISRSLRSVESLLVQGSARRLSNGVMEIEMRTIDAVNYSVKAWNDGDQKRRLLISIPLKRRGSRYLTPIPSLPELAAHQINLVRFRFTTDGWKTASEVKGHLVRDRRSGLLLNFEDVQTFPLVGQLEGYCHLRGTGATSKPGKSRTNRYVYAIPDQRELEKLVADRSL